MKWRTTIANARAPQLAGLVARNRGAGALDPLCLADLTDVCTWACFVYVAFVIDTYSRFICGCQTAKNLHRPWPGRPQNGPLAAPGGGLDGFIHHSDCGV